MVCMVGVFLTTNVSGWFWVPEGALSLEMGHKLDNNEGNVEAFRED